MDGLSDRVEEICKSLRESYTKGREPLIFMYDR